MRRRSSLGSSVGERPRARPAAGFATWTRRRARRSCGDHVGVGPAGGSRSARSWLRDGSSSDHTRRAARWRPPGRAAAILRFMGSPPGRAAVTAVRPSGGAATECVTLPQLGARNPVASRARRASLDEGCRPPNGSIRRLPLRIYRFSPDAVRRRHPGLPGAVRPAAPPDPARAGRPLRDLALDRSSTRTCASSRHMDELDLEVATEFLMIAATLVELKTKRLLPGRDRPRPRRRAGPLGGARPAALPPARVQDVQGRRPDAAAPGGGGRAAPTPAPPGLEEQFLGLAPDLLEGIDARRPAAGLPPGHRRPSRCPPSTSPTSTQCG